MRTLVRDCLLRLCGRIIDADGALSRSDVYEWLQGESGDDEVLLGAMTLELSALRSFASSSVGSVHRDDIRIVCEAHPLETVERQTLRALADDAHRNKCAGVQRHTLPDSEIALEPNAGDSVPVDAIAVAPEGGIGTLSSKAGGNEATRSGLVSS
jgi:hypothetical protein